ncbi:hypothetical protein [Vallitalea maricola]|uniref:Uncharacterized protein n=1 Tax=Vallitalea maricola TaxID=3074433 RepID=A0ACB5UMT5_9FIRM|nr:hypothetical protein AN2V17_30640 [Vallitalea sp. AN17-2]
MIHLIDNIKIPDTMGKILQYIDTNTESFLDSYERAYEVAYMLYNLSPAVLHAYFGDDGYEVDYTPELFYDDIPFELIPFSYNGYDGLNYSWVNLAPELNNDDYMCVSFAPGENGAQWLGNNTAQALTNILKAQLKDRKITNPNRLSKKEKKQWDNLVEVIGIDVDNNLKIESGGRINSTIKPIIPENYKYVQTMDGIGVLAQKRFFKNEDLSLAELLVSESYLDIAKKYLLSNHAASALIVLKNARQKNGNSIELMQLYKTAYEQLGRENHAKRLEIWLNKTVRI